ncbi:MAG: hypothetical protein KDC87_05100, partial [Planctomycetes bacterium]|nr:hypothetical protein [Planctomycetota bacterium]
LVTSALYRASSAAGASHEVAWFARRSARPMPRETFEHAVSDALAARPPASRPASPLATQLALLNGPYLHQAADRSRTLDTVAELAPDRASLLHTVFALLLTRPPAEAERRLFLPVLENGRQGLGDVVFAILASREFGSIR